MRFKKGERVSGGASLVLKVSENEEPNSFLRWYFESSGGFDRSYPKVENYKNQGMWNLFFEIEGTCWLL